MEKLESSLAKSLCLSLEEVDLAALAKYAEAVELRRKEELVDDSLSSALDTGMIFPIIVSEDGKIIDGFRRVSILLQKYKNVVERKQIKIPVLKVCRDLKVPPEVLRFIVNVLAKPPKSVEACRNEAIDALSRKSHYSLMEMCPTCKVALILDSYPECPAENCIPPSVKRAVHSLAEKCLDIMALLVQYSPPDVASAEMKKALTEFHGRGLNPPKRLEEIKQNLDAKLRVTLEMYLPPKPRTPDIVETPKPKEPTLKEETPERTEEAIQEAHKRAEEADEESEEEVAKRVEEKAKRAEELVESVEEEPDVALSSALIYLERLSNETLREEVETAVKKKRRLYQMALSAGIPKSLAQLMVLFFTSDEIEQMVVAYREALDKTEFVKRFVERVDKLRSSKVVTLDLDSFNKLLEMARTFNYPLPFFLGDVVQAIYNRYAKGEYHTLDKFLKDLAGS